MKIIGDIIGIAIIGIVLAVIAHYTPERTLTGGMFIFFFLVLAVMGIYFWHHEELPHSSRKWAAKFGIATLAAVIIFGIGVGFAYVKGIRGDAIEMVSSNGTFLLLTIYCPTVILVAFAGLLRAIVIEKLAK